MTEQEIGYRIKGEYKTRKVFIDGEEHSPKQSLSYRKFYPGGFGWGNSGLASSQLSFAILLRLLSLELALQWFHEFMEDFVSKFPNSDFETELPEAWKIQFRVTRRLNQWSKKHLQR
jgi:hypothetical protein